MQRLFIYPTVTNLTFRDVIQLTPSPRLPRYLELGLSVKSAFDHFFSLFYSAVRAYFLDPTRNEVSNQTDR